MDMLATTLIYMLKKIRYLIESISTLLQVCCAVSFGHVCGSNEWRAALVSSHDVSSVTLDTSACTGQTHVVAAVRYAWSESPCDLLKCAVYSRDNDLPGPPFIEHAPFH